MEIKRNHYLNILISKKNNGLIKVITGMHRCGKSYLLFTLFKEYLLKEGVDEEHIIEIAFDTFENKHLCDPYALYPYLKERIKMITRANYLNRIYALNGTPDIKIITDIRQSGRLVLLLLASTAHTPCVMP